MLLPDKNAVAQVLARYRERERLVMADPHDHDVRSSFESTAYTLCVLIGERTARSAAQAAQRYVTRRAEDRALLHHTSSIAVVGNSARLVNHTPHLPRTTDEQLKAAPLEDRRVR